MSAFMLRQTWFDSGRRMSWQRRLGTVMAAELALRGTACSGKVHDGSDSGAGGGAGLPRGSGVSASGAGGASSGGTPSAAGGANTCSDLVDMARAAFSDALQGPSLGCGSDDDASTGRCPPASPLAAPPSYRRRTLRSSQVLLALPSSCVLVSQVRAASLTRHHRVHRSKPRPPA